MQTHVNEGTCKKCSTLQLYVSQNLETVRPQQNEHNGVKTSHTPHTQACGKSPDALLSKASQSQTKTQVTPLLSSITTGTISLSRLPWG